MGDRGRRSRGDRRRQGRRENEPGSVGTDGVYQRPRAGNVAAERAKGFCQSSLDDIDPSHDPIPLCNAGATAPIHADSVHLVEIGHGAVARRKVADRLERRDVAVHRIDALEHDQLWAAGRCVRQQLFQMLKVIVAPDLFGAAGGTHPFDHGIVVERI